MGAALRTQKVKKMSKPGDDVDNSAKPADEEHRKENLVKYDNVCDCRLCELDHEDTSCGEREELAKGPIESLIERPQISQKANPILTCVWDQVRQQVLPRESLLDVFSYVDRRTLDGANVVSRAYNTTAQHAPPVRIVTDARLYFNLCDQTLYVTYYYNRVYRDTTKGRTNTERAAVRMVADNVEEAVVIFFRLLRFSNVRRGINLYHFQIQQPFVDQLKAATNHFLCKDYQLAFTDVTLADGVHALDLLLAFPTFRKLNGSTFDLLEKSVRSGDELLKAAALRGVFYLFAEWPFDDCSFSERAILDFTFGDYIDDEEVRKLEVNWARVSKKLLVSLIQACRGCRSKLKIDLKITSIQRALAVDELLANGVKHPNEDGVPYVWRFSFNDLPELNIEYKPPFRPEPSFAHDWEKGELHCWGTIHGPTREV